MLPVRKPIEQLQQARLGKGLVQEVHSALTDQVNSPL